MGFFGKSKEEKLADAAAARAALDPALLFAAERGNVASARAALDSGANKDCKDGVRLARALAHCAAKHLPRRTTHTRRSAAEQAAAAAEGAVGFMAHYAAAVCSPRALADATCALRLRHSARLCEPVP